MSSEWKRLTLKDAGVILIDCDHRTPQALDEGYPYIAIPQLKNGHIELDGVRRISRADYIDWTKKLKPKFNDVIVVRRCNSGESAHVPDELDCAIGQNLVVLRASGEKVLPAFLRWLLRGPEWWGQVSKFINVGAVFDSLRCRDIPNFELTIPPLEKQHEIVGVLGVIDDRVISLRKNNFTMESISQSLFKSWFVDFEPVHLRAKGLNSDGMSSEIASLFPDSFMLSDQGLIPSGWRVAKLGSVCDYLSRGLSPKYVEEGGVLVVNQRCIRGFSIDYSKARRHDPLQRKIDGRTIRPGDVLVNSTGVGTLGRVAQVLELPEQAIVDSHVTVVRAGPLLNWTFLGQWMTHKQPEIEAMGEGTTGQTELAKSKLSDIFILVPSKAVLAAFDELVAPLKRRIALNESLINNLDALREILLPRLISGQLRTSKAKDANIRTLLESV